MSPWVSGKGKRVLDICLSLVGIVILSPLLALIAVAVKMGDGGPVFFRQERVGHNGRRFRIWKFRTMAVGADKMGPLLTVGQDPRVTKVGWWLRRTKLDELPQLINVLAGEMSLVGPRPEVPRYVALYTEEQKAVLKLRPGITDPASIRFRNESELLATAADPERYYVEIVMPEKIRLNLEYASKASVWTDIAVIIHTLLRLWR